MFLSHCQINLLIWKKLEEEENYILRGMYGISQNISNNNLFFYHLSFGMVFILFLTYSFVPPRTDCILAFVEFGRTLRKNKCS